MLKKVINISIIVLIISLFSSCSSYQKLLKSEDDALKYEKAISYYNDGNYYKALQLFDQLVTVYRGTSKAEKIYYYYANCYYQQKDYVLANYYFNRYAKNYPKSPLTEECYFMAAYCKFLDSPAYNLDQESTYDAIKELQLFVNRYPNSDRVEECNKYLDILRDKLEKKDYNIAKLYYNMSEYKSAICAFNNLLKTYPDSKHKEEILLYLMKTYYYYANNSITSKKKSRYQSAEDAYNSLITLFPTTKYIKSANTIHNNILKELKQL
ncbi:MAG: outer membrane protein assembly factor BamD [Bacteroidales bacterium]|nr:outer membrane protein assembly factor BamD [Bacteroidales bacterium]